MYDVIIVGAGASGCFLALTLKYKNPNLKVALIEKNDKLGKKLLITGNGRCNLGNTNITIDNYNSSSSLNNFISQLEENGYLNYLKNFGILTKKEDTSTRLYPYSNQAITVCKSFERALEKEKVNVILDTDTYNECDDQFALAYLIKSQDKFNIEAITVAPYSHTKRDVKVIDGQELSYNEILKICNWLNFDYDNKVFKGSMDYVQNGYDEDNDAVNKIIEVALKNDKTYIMAIGTITNVALAIKKEPKIINRIEIVWLGGNEPNYKDNLEFNFKQDVKAVKTVFNSDVKLTILPCHNVVNNLMIDVNTLKDKLENKSELCNYLMDRFYNDGYHGVQNKRVIWDISVIAYMINKNWFETKDVCCPIIKDDTSYEPTNNKRMITFVTKLDKDKIYEDLFKKLGE